MKTRHGGRFQVETRKQTKGISIKDTKDLPSRPKTFKRVHTVSLFFPVKVNRMNNIRRGLGNKSLKNLSKKVPKQRKKPKKNGSSTGKKKRNRSWLITTPNPVHVNHFESDAKSNDMYFDDDSITIFACHVS